MADLTIPNTLAALTEITATPHNQNYSAIATYVNARNNGTAWDVLAVTGASTLTGAVSVASTLSVTGVSTFTGGVASLFGYRRPNLSYISVTTVDVENNTGTSNQTTIVFPDGTVRSVTEDTSSTSKYRRFLITETAEFLTGTENSGLYSGLSETTNTWYAMYAVKSQINTANFVLVGTTTLPTRANFATLNTNLGTNSWVYLGMIRNGDNSGATGDILSFVQAGHLTSFSNSALGTSAVNFPGTILVSANSGSACTYTYAAGTGTAQIPNHLKQVSFSCGGAAGDQTIVGTVNAPMYARAVGYVLLPNVSAAESVSLSNNSQTRDVSLAGFIDPLLDGTYQVI